MDSKSTKSNVSTLFFSNFYSSLRTKNMLISYQRKNYFFYLKFCFEDILFLAIYRFIYLSASVCSVCRLLCLSIFFSLASCKFMKVLFIQDHLNHNSKCEKQSLYKSLKVAKRWLKDSL